MKENLARPPITKDEVRATKKQMKMGKATGPDNIAVEQIEALEDVGIESLTFLLNEVYDTGVMPADMKKSIFIVLAKKADTT
ncbi:hypothetical protein PoB_002191800 [Plakobranchus ocellatus]|uniref:Uncharacterized protein n=1 Tax=Plakobranchus ocellatus TaxID=259542 RepID=A0AAV3ZLF0_9GAST|nr:hypothetical protein PoB_002191800 [Plakobranchus ocellatus]